MNSLIAFVRESNLIEGIDREPTADELDVTGAFLLLETVSINEVQRLQAVYAPGKPLRERVGMDVRVGRYVAPRGGSNIRSELMELCQRVMSHGDPWREHVVFENLHPFLDGNGRTGRAIWAWHMQKIGADPFALSFLHRFYYQTLDASGR